MEKLPTNPPFKLVAERLKEHFASSTSKELWLNELELLRRGEKETIPQLAHKVMDKLPKAFPRMTKEDRERLGIRYFTKALIDPQQRLDIRIDQIYTRNIARLYIIIYMRDNWR